MRDGEKRSSVVRTVIITLTVIAAIAAVAAVLYNLFKKYFKVSLDRGDCDDCSSGCFGDDLEARRRLSFMTPVLQGTVWTGTMLIGLVGLALVQGLCDRIMVMQGGGIVEEGKNSEVLHNPQNDYTKLLISSVLEI